MDNLNSKHCCSSFVQQGKNPLPKNGPQSGLLLRVGICLPHPSGDTVLRASALLFSSSVMDRPEQTGTQVYDGQKKEGYYNTIASKEPNAPQMQLCPQQQGQGRRARKKELKFKM